MAYTDHLSKDKVLSRLIVEQGPVELVKRKNICLYLCSSIMSQQLSVKVAAVIFQRFLDLFDGKEPDARAILNVSKETLRSIGLSNAKCAYVHNVAAFAEEHGMERKKLDMMNDEAVIQYLTPIKGVGRWTVEMLLIFALGREDVFAVDDLGIQNAMCRFYKLENSDKKLMKEKMLKRSAKWRPYRTYACLHLWRGLSVTPLTNS